MDDDMRYGPSLEEVIVAIMEGKQVGKVYHFTNLFLLNKMATQQPPFVMVSRNGLFSMTRNPYLNQPPFSSSFRDLDVRIALDGTRMTDMYKVNPIAGRPDDIAPDSRDHKRPTMDRSKGEAEEYVQVPSGGLNILPYITSISILRKASHTPETVEQTLAMLGKLKIPFAYEKTLR